MIKSESVYQFNLGNYECLVISDGLFTVPDGSMVDVMCLLVKTGQHTVLVDTGCGGGLDPNAGKLMQNLRFSGISNREIDTVVLSHAHSDHAGGNTDTNSKPSFPDARYYIGKKEMEFWTGTPDLLCYPEAIRQTIKDTIEKKLICIEDRLVKVSGEEEIVPGVFLINTPGHSPGNMAMLISSSGENLVYTGDVFMYPEEIEHLDRFSAPLMTDEGIETRLKILEEIVKRKALVFACHFPFPGLGRISRKGKIYAWEPIKTA